MVKNNKARANATSTAPEPGKQAAQSLKKRVTRTVKLEYLLYLPDGYGKEPDVRWPLVLFLHGAGERGSELERVASHGPPLLAAQGKSFPFVIVSPQCPENEWWQPETLKVLLDDIERRYTVDRDRIYLTGLSMGGYGTWAVAMAYPDRFAAIAPICGGGMARRVRLIKHVPAWVFHGARDPLVQLKEGQEMVDALKAAAGDVRLTVYPEAEHDSWTETYDNPELYRWLLSHRRQSAR